MEIIVYTFPVYNLLMIRWYIPRVASCHHKPFKHRLPSHLFSPPPSTLLSGASVARRLDRTSGLGCEPWWFVSDIGYSSWTLSTITSTGLEGICMTEESIVCDAEHIIFWRLIESGSLWWLKGTLSVEKTWLGREEKLTLPGKMQKLSKNDTSELQRVL